MPAAAPSIHGTLRHELNALGERLAAVRKAARISATAAAEAAGVSRTTLHRIERGEPSVAMAAWIAVAYALGASFTVTVTGPKGSTSADAEPGLPDRIRVRDFPQLKALAWQLKPDAELTPEEALQLYERNWRHVDRARLGLDEIELIRRLAKRFGAEKVLV